MAGRIPTLFFSHNTSASGRRHRGKEVPDAADPPTPAKTLQRLELLVPDEVMGDGWGCVVLVPQAGDDGHHLPPKKTHIRWFRNPTVFCVFFFSKKMRKKKQHCISLIVLYSIHEHVFFIIFIIFIYIFNCLQDFVFVWSLSQQEGI